MTAAPEPLVPPSRVDVASRAEEIAARFHAGLIASDPDIAALFAGKNPAVIQRRLAQTLVELAEASNDPERLVALLVPLGRRHASYGVRAESYPLAVEVMTDALREVLAEGFTEAVEEEWRTTIELVAAVMQRAATGDGRPA